MKKYIALAAILLGAGVTSVIQAQSNLTAITYEASIPLSDTKDFTSSTSFIGFSFDSRRFVQPNTTIGLSIALHVFDNKINDELIQFENVFESDRNVDVWGTQYRYINSWPLMGTAYYYLGNRRDQLRPYLGTGIGAFVARRRLDVGLTSIAETKWQFGFTPEVGILFGFSDGGLILKAKYNYGLKSGDVPSLSYFTVGAGFAFTGY